MKKLYLKSMAILLLCLFHTMAFAQNNITGTVRDATGPLPNVSVLLKGSSTGTQTNSEGRFSISAKPTDLLVISMIGYTTQELPVGNQTTLTITLMESAKSLEEVVVTSLGIRREQKSLGYAVSTITSKQLTEAGNTNFASALYGKAAGVKITTAPGGASSAVNVQIRGINSLGYNQQPLYVVDGVMIRNDAQNGAAGANNNDYWGDQRIRGNGILDINPSDIESLTVLKGASATALYGSDANSGVVVITTKRGSKARGLGIDFNYTASIENAAFLPEFQNVYGPGYDHTTNLANGATAEGWIPDATSPTGFRPYFRAYGNFGPKMEGQQVKWWDGSIRSFSAQPDNYADVYETGYNSTANVAISNQTDAVNYRFSATRLDYRGTQPGNNMQKNSFNLNSSVKLHPNLTTDVVVSYVNTKTHNRPYQLGQVLGSFGGFFSRAEDMNLMKQKFQTSGGYKYATFDQTDRPEPFLYNIRATNLLDFYWQQLRNSYDETENRLLSSATINWNATNHLKFRGRIGNDFTAVRSENRQYNELPLANNPTSNSTGNYATTQGQYAILYGDALVTYDNKIGEDFAFSASAGFQGRTEEYRDGQSSTAQGLVSENWFSLSNSYGVVTSTENRKELVKYAYLGILNFSYKDYLFIEGTARQEYASTLPVANNSYFYPSVNSSFVFSEAFQLPEVFSFGKVRASYGIVGNAPPMYESNIFYTQTSLQTVNGSVPALTGGRFYGNNTLTSEMKHEAEFGLEARFLNSRLGFDISYYSNRVKDQILPLQTSSTVGATSQLVNVGEIGSQGLEIAFNASPIVSDSFRWDTRLNFSSNRSKVHSLMPGVTELPFYYAEQNTVKIVAKVGERLGNIYVNPRLQDANGNLVINDDGLYVMDKANYVLAGNIMPKMVGGMSNTLSYKAFSLDFTVDYSLGGKMVSPPTKFMTGAGMLTNSMQYRDTENGGLTYTDGGVTYNDGVLLAGVNQNTGLPNEKIISAGEYYINTFNWGEDSWSEEGSIFKNNFVKVREAVLSYKVPASFASKIGINNFRVSLVGRNLFYLYRTMKNLDPEAPLGNKWWSQGVDVGSTAATRSFGFSLNANF
ncbi:iron complex outermembrane receptor protein [Pedobacter sp. CAN_A7]|uniref:SusC/RagA family TonB-linked outer membrane protein n=1 Tax=Pedobacter sp. CAN_A7 TaxID=2787722 RepID=UPI0018C9EFDE